MKKILASAALSTTVLTGGLIAGSTSAFAQDDVPDDSTPDESIPTESETTGPERDGEGCNKLGGLAETLGLDAEELRRSLDGGMSLADIAEAEGISVDDVVDALLDQRTERIEGAVDAGRITEEEAVEKLAAAEERITEQVNSEDGFDGRRGHGRRGNGGPAADDADANTDAGFTPGGPSLNGPSFDGAAVADAAVSA